MSQRWYVPLIHFANKIVTRCWLKTLFPATDHSFIASLNLTVLLSLCAHFPITPLSLYSCNYCINEKKSELIWYSFSFQPAVSHIFFYWRWRLSRVRLFVMLPFRGILFYWCRLVLRDDLYDNIMCRIFPLAGDLLTCWFSYFQFRMTCLFDCALRKFSDLWFMKTFLCWLNTTTTTRLSSYKQGNWLLKSWHFPH